MQVASPILAPQPAPEAPSKPSAPADRASESSSFEDTYRDSEAPGGEERETAEAGEGADQTAEAPERDADRDRSASEGEDRTPDQDVQAPDFEAEIAVPSEGDVAEAEAPLVGLTPTAAASEAPAADRENPAQPVLVGPAGDTGVEAEPALQAPVENVDADADGAVTAEVKPNQTAADDMPPPIAPVKAAREAYRAAAGAAEGIAADRAAATAPTAPTAPTATPTAAAAGVAAATAPALDPRLAVKAEPLDPAKAIQAAEGESIAASAEPRTTPETKSSAEVRSAPVRADAPRPVATQIAGAIRQGQDGLIEVSLVPEELGRVKLSLQAGDGTLHLAVQAERPETQDLIRRHIGQLEAELASLGFSDVAFDFSAPGGQSGDADDAGTPAEESAIALDRAEDAGVVPPTGALPVTGRLDLRL